MKILITGATSGLGRNAVDFLQQHNIACRATGRNVQQGKLIQQMGIEFVAADLALLTDDIAEQLLTDIDTVWHCAALSSPWGKYESFYLANVTATKKLTYYAARYKIKNFIHISTPSIYFDYQNHFNIKESYQAKKPVNNYAITKLFAEQHIKAAAIKNPDITFIILRPRAIFGEHDSVLLPRLFKMVRQKKGKLILPHAGKSIIDMTYVLNVIEAMYLATQLPLEKKKMISGNAYNITNQDPVPFKSVLNTLFCEKFNIPITIKSLPYPVIDLIARGLSCWGNYKNKEPLFTRYSIGALSFDMTLSNVNAQRDLGYFPKYSLDEAINRTVEWFNKHGNNH